MYGSSTGVRPSPTTTRVCGVLALGLVLFVLFRWSDDRNNGGSYTGKGGTQLNQMLHNPYNRIGEPLVLVSIISCRTLSCARQRQVLRDESWPSHLTNHRVFGNASAPLPQGYPKRIGPDAPFPVDHWRRAVSYVFVIGREVPELVSISSTPEQLAAEQYMNADMLFLDVPDNFEGFTSKTRALLGWLDDSDPCYVTKIAGRQPATDWWTPCANADARNGVPVLPRFSFYMKVDDDVFVHVPHLVDALRTYRAQWQSIPYHRRGRVVARTQFKAPVIRDKKKRWSDSTFPLDFYPPYPLGPGYVFNREALFPIANVARSMFSPAYINEDTTVGVWMSLLGSGVVDHAQDLRFQNSHIPCQDDMIIWHHDTPYNPREQNNKVLAVERFHRDFTKNVYYGCPPCSGCPTAPS